MSDPLENEDVDWDALIVAGIYPSVEIAWDYQLVVLAMGRACWLRQFPETQQVSLFVDAKDFADVIDEFRAFAEEQTQWQPERDFVDDISPRRACWHASLAWIFLLVAGYVYQNQMPNVLESYASSSRAIVEHGEWWRVATALLLHADIGHLLGNLLSGSIFAYWVAEGFGRWLGLAMILIAGSAGNALTAITKSGENFSSIGASTASFAALGILSGYALVTLRVKRKPKSIMHGIAPLLGGLVILAMLGGNALDGRVDVLGHVFGFACGFVLGLVVAAVKQPFSKLAL